MNFNLKYKTFTSVLIAIFNATLLCRLVCFVITISKSLSFERFFLWRRTNDQFYETKNTIWIARRSNAICWRNLFPDQQQKHVSFMRMIVDEKFKDLVIINTKLITISSEESFKLKLKIDEITLHQVTIS